MMEWLRGQHFALMLGQDSWATKWLDDMPLDEGSLLGNCLDGGSGAVGEFHTAVKIILMFICSVLSVS